PSAVSKMIVLHQDGAAAIGVSKRPHQVIAGRERSDGAAFENSGRIVLWPNAVNTRAGELHEGRAKLFEPGVEAAGFLEMTGARAVAAKDGTTFRKFSAGGCPSNRNTSPPWRRRPARH